MENQSSGFMSSLRAFGRGLLKGAITGALISATLALVMLTFSAFGLAAAPTAFLLPAALMASTTAIFTGLMGVYHDYQHRKEAANSPMREGHIAAASPTVVPMIVPTVAQDRAESPAQSTPEQEAPARNWASSVAKDPANGNRIQEILSNKQIDDKTRAAAILAEREARAATPAEAAR
jgi:hypothetical protein